MDVSLLTGREIWRRKQQEKSCPPSCAALDSRHTGNTGARRLLNGRLPGPVRHGTFTSPSFPCPCPFCTAGADVFTAFITFCTIRLKKYIKLSN